MFGFPFMTSLVVVLSGVVVMSLLVNKGLSKRSKSTHNTSATADTPQTHPQA